MIVSKDTRPEKQVYYLGSLLLEILKDVPNGDHNTFEWFEQMNRREPVSIHAFSLTLDWLFLLGAIDNQSGVVKKCF